MRRRFGFAKIKFVKLQVKIWLGAFAFIGAFAALDAYLGYRDIESNVTSELGREAHILRAVLTTSWRTYHEQYVEHGLSATEADVGLLPAYAQSRIALSASNWIGYGVRFNNVSDRPRNPANQADENELTAMDWFRENPKVTEHSVVISSPEGDVYQFSAPIWTEKSCLSCHGERDAAPLWVQKRYSRAYGYHVGDLRGIVSIKLPMADLRDSYRDAWLRRFGVRAIGYVGLLTGLGVLLSY